MHDVFMSFSREDRQAAKVIADRLMEAGMSVYLDPEVIVTGQSFVDTVRKEIMDSRAVVALLSSQSNRSSYVETELQNALDNKKLVVPVLLDKGAKNNWLWPLLATRQSISLDLESPSWKAEVKKLVQSLSLAIGKGADSQRFPEIIGGQISERSMRRTDLWKTVALAIVCAAAGAAVTWLLTH